MSENLDSKDVSNGVSTPETEAPANQDLSSSPIPRVDSKEDMFMDATDVMQENQSRETDSNGTQDAVDTASVDELHYLREMLDKTIAEKERISKQHEEERGTVLREAADLRHQLKALTSKELVPSDCGGQEEIAGDVSLSEVISGCSQFVKAASEERLQSETVIRELQQQIEDLTGRVQLDQNVEYVTDRILASLVTVVNQEQLLDYSVLGKITHVERGTSLLIQQYSYILYEIDQLKQCLYEGTSNLEVQEGYGPVSVLAAGRGELLELKRKEMEITEKIQSLEDDNRKLVEEIKKEKTVSESANEELGRVKTELEQEKNRCANTKEKLSMAVTKGKALVHQRDSLKQSLAEKTSELERFLVELQEKSIALEASELCKEKLVNSEKLVTSLQETLSQRNSILESFEEIFSKTSVLEELRSTDIVERLKLVVNLVTSQQEMLSQKNSTFENIEAILAKASVPGELKSGDLIERLKWLVDVAASLQEMLSHKNSTFENIEAIVAEANVPGELKSADLIEKLKWLVDEAASLQETLSQRNKIMDNLEQIFSQISVPVELLSMNVAERLQWLVEERNALKNDLLESQKLKDALSLINLPEAVSSLDLETRIGWLKEFIDQGKGETNMLQDEIVRTKEAANNEIECLSASLLAALQEKEYIKVELDDLVHKYEEIVKREHQVSLEKDQMVRILLEGSGITADNPEGDRQTYSDLTALMNRCLEKVKEQSDASAETSPANAEMCERMQSLLYVRDQELMLSEKLLEEDLLVRSEVTNLSNKLGEVSAKIAALKEEKDSLRKDLERSEEKSAMIREKLSLAVKKGKGLVQDRENLKLLLDYKNAEIEKLKLELQQQESIVDDCKDQINKLSTDLEQIPKLEEDFVAMKAQRNQLEQFLLESNNMLQRVIESIDCIVLPVDAVFVEPVEKLNWLTGYMNECQQARTHAEQDLEKVKLEANTLASTLAEAQQTIKSLEDVLSSTEEKISQLAEEKRETEIARKNVEQELQKAIDEATAQANRFTEACATRKSLEDALLLAENNISMLTKGREEAQLSKAAAESELKEVKEEVSIQTSKLTEAYKTIKALEDAVSQAEANVSSLTEQNNLLHVGRNNFMQDLEKLKQETESQAGKLADASTKIKSLEDAVARATNDISILENEKRISEQEISMLNSKLSTCMDELAGTNGSIESRSVEVINHLSDLGMLMKNESPLSIIRQHFEKELEKLKNMDLILKDMKNHFAGTDLPVLKSHPIMEEDSHVMKTFPNDLGNNVNYEMDNDEVNARGADNISLYFKKTSEGFQLRNKIFIDNFEELTLFIDENIEALMRKLRVTEDAVITVFEHMESMRQKLKSMEMHNEQQEKTIATLEDDCKVLLSACTTATRELQFEAKNKLLKLSSIPELEKLNHSLIPEVSEVGADDMYHQQGLDDHKHVEMAKKLLLATRKVQNLVIVFESTGNVAATTIEDLQTKLKETRAAAEKAERERDLMQNRVFELEADAEVLQNSCKELMLKVEDYQAIEEKLNEKETELSTLRDNLLMKEKDAEKPLVSASELKALLDKMSGIESYFAESKVADVEPYGSTYIKKLFYIVEIVPEMSHQINVLSHEKDKLQSTLSTHILEIEHLKEELETLHINKQDYEKMRSEVSELIFGLEKIIQMLGGNEMIGDKELTGFQRHFSVVEKQITTLLLEAENAKSQAQEFGANLVASQKFVDELSNKVKLLEDCLQSRTVQPETVQEKSVFEKPPLPTGSEISEIEDAGPVGKNAIPSVASAAALRTMRKGSADHLALNIDSESTSLVNNGETDEDKGHVFKSLNTSGLIPKQGKLLADRIDGIWVSGGRVLMNRPRARLGLIAYSLILHLWLLGTILL